MNLNEAAIELAKDLLANNGYTVTPPPPTVKYRPAEWPRDWGRTDAEFDYASNFSHPEIGVLVGKSPKPHPWACETNGVKWHLYCRVPILPGDEYRAPVLPQDAGKECEFSDDGASWVSGILTGYASLDVRDDSPWCDGKRYYKHARIRR